VIDRSQIGSALVHSVPFATLTSDISTEWYPSRGYLVGIVDSLLALEDRRVMSRAMNFCLETLHSRADADRFGAFSHSVLRCCAGSSTQYWLVGFTSFGPIGWR
jgi:hypothetical protein